MTSTYPSYKPTPIPWLPQIPEHWGLLRNKYIMREIVDRSNSGMEDLLSVSQYTGVTLKKDKLENDDDLLTTAATLEGYKKVQKDDLVINIMLAWNGSLGVSPYDGITSPAYSVYRFNEKINPKYFHYLFRTKAMSSYFRSVSSGVIESRLRMYTIDFFKLYSFIPPLPEQTAIANYLDSKTDEINTFIAKKQKLIALLKEQKQAIINEFLQDKEGKWEKRKLKYVAKINNINLSEKTNPDYSFTYLDIGSVDSSGNTADSVQKIAFKDAPSRARRVIRKGDVIISTVRTYLQSITYFDHDIEDTIVSTGYAVLSPNPKLILPDFLNFAVRKIEVLDEIMANSIGITYPAISALKLANFKICVPSPFVQKEIIDKIQKVTYNINITITRIETEIELVKELKQSLIAEVVTGKIKIA